MSVDERLHAAFGQEDRSWEADVTPALSVVRRTARRRDVTRRGLVAGGIAGAAAAVTVGVVIVWGLASTDQDIGPAPLPSTTTSAPVGPVLEGTWDLSGVTRSDLRRTLHGAGLVGHLGAIVSDLPDLPLRLELVVSPTEVELIAFGGSGGPWVLDQEFLLVTGNQLEITAQDTAGTTSYRWTVVGDTLDLDYVGTTEPAVKGVPAEAWQRVLYTSGAFTRQ